MNEPPAAHERILAEAERIRSLGEAVSRLARDPVNQPHINDWLEAMGNANPRFHQGEAPPSMTQAWTMYGLVAPRDPNDPLHAMMGVLTAEGFTSVLGTNCEQTYERYLRVGEQLRVTVRLDSVVGPKKTGMGEGYFVTSISTWYVEHEDGTSEKVGEMLFRVLKFRPKDAAATDGPGDFVLYPTINRDTEYFWEGTAAGELRIQKCGQCGALRHPPGPSCPRCHAFEREYVVAGGGGTVYSQVVHHHPPIPGHALPVRLALVDLDEGVRMVATVADNAEVAIGDRVEVGFRRIDDSLTLPVWKPVWKAVR